MRQDRRERFKKALIPCLVIVTGALTFWLHQESFSQNMTDHLGIQPLSSTINTLDQFLSGDASQES